MWKMLKGRGLPIRKAKTRTLKTAGCGTRRGEMVGGNDLWIAAHAKAAGLVLVANNEREFRRIPDLKVQNWTTRVS
jgi:predicted nucleic acid-binding protein